MSPFLNSDSRKPAKTSLRQAVRYLVYEREEIIIYATGNDLSAHLRAKMNLAAIPWCC